MPDDPILSRLREVPLFGGLSKRDLRAVAATGREVELAPGESVVHEGLAGADMYVILSGEVEITRGAERLGTLGPGEHFGELSAITGAPRSATVTATSRTFALRLDADAMRRFLERHGAAAYEMLVVVCRRLQAAAPSPTQ
jgi:CRP/FNR family transcriptional regulator, cyclic AMP receptor protein